MHKTKRFIIAVFVSIFTLVLSSCSSTVNYSVDKEHEDKIKTIYNMVKGLVENDSELYLSTFEPEYIENVKNVVDTLGTQYFDAENFDDMIKTFFEQTTQGMEANYGEKFDVKISFNSVKELSAESLGEFFDDYSVNYTFPKDKITSVAETSTKIHISSDTYNDGIDCKFILLQMNNQWYIHPESFLFSF